MLEGFLPVKVIEVDKRGFDPGEITKSTGQRGERV